MSDVLWSHTKGLLRGMERKHHQALSPETDQDPLEVQAVVQVQCETECERTCVVYALMASVVERVYALMSVHRPMLVLPVVLLPCSKTVPAPLVHTLGSFGPLLTRSFAYALFCCCAPQIFEFAFELRVFQVQHDKPSLSPAEQLALILPDKGRPNLKIADAALKWFVFPALVGGNSWNVSKSQTAKNASQQFINAVHEVCGTRRGRISLYSLRKGYYGVSEAKGRNLMARNAMDHEQGSDSNKFYRPDHRGMDSGGNRRGVGELKPVIVPYSAVALRDDPGQWPSLSSFKTAALEDPRYTDYRDKASRSAAQLRTKFKSVQGTLRAKAIDARFANVEETRCGSWVEHHATEATSGSLAEPHRLVLYKDEPGSEEIEMEIRIHQRPTGRTLKQVVLDGIAARNGMAPIVSVSVVDGKKVKTVLFPAWKAPAVAGARSGGHGSVSSGSGGSSSGSGKKRARSPSSSNGHEAARGTRSRPSPASAPASAPRFRGTI